MRKPIKIKKRDLVANSVAEREAEGHTDDRGWNWVGTDWIDGYVDDVVVGIGDHMTTELMAVFERDGELWGIEDWTNGEDDGFGEIKMDDEVTCRPVRLVAKPTYEYED